MFRGFPEHLLFHIMRLSVYVQGGSEIRWFRNSSVSPLRPFLKTQWHHVKLTKEIISPKELIEIQSHQYSIYPVTKICIWIYKKNAANAPKVADERGNVQVVITWMSVPGCLQTWLNFKIGPNYNNFKVICILRFNLSWKGKGNTFCFRARGWGVDLFCLNHTFLQRIFTRYFTTMKMLPFYGREF